jgi:hypothetical protein
MWLPNREREALNQGTWPPGNPLSAYRFVAPRARDIDSKPLQTSAGCNPRQRFGGAFQGELEP